MDLNNKLLALLQEYTDANCLAEISKITKDWIRISETMEKLSKLDIVQKMIPSIKGSFLRRAESLLKRYWLDSHKK